MTSGKREATSQSNGNGCLDERERVKWRRPARHSRVVQGRRVAQHTHKTSVAIANSSVQDDWLPCVILHGRINRRTQDGRDVE